MADVSLKAADVMQHLIVKIEVMSKTVVSVMHMEELAMST